MQSDTFREWLAERGCRFEQHESQRGEGHASVTVRRDGREAVLPLIGTRQDIDEGEVRRIVEALGLDPAELPRDRSRV